MDCASDDLAYGGLGSGMVVVEESIVLAEDASLEMYGFFSFYASLLNS